MFASRGSTRIRETTGYRTTGFSQGKAANCFRATVFVFKTRALYKCKVFAQQLQLVVVSNSFCFIYHAVLCKMCSFFV